MVELVIAAVVIAVGALLFSFFRAKRKISRMQEELFRAWQEVSQALAARVSALEELASALRAAGYVSEGEHKLREALAQLRRSGTDPRELAEAHERVEGVLRGIYRALPREREERVRVAQNRLAEADEELDLRKNRYNELVLTWYEISRRFPFRLLMRKIPRPEPFALPGEEEALLRRHLPGLD
jgi:hypothetical protein